MVFLFMIMVTIMFIIHLDKVLGADEAVPLFVKHSESFSDVALDVRVLELPLMEERQHIHREELFSKDENHLDILQMYTLSSATQTH